MRRNSLLVVVLLCLLGGVAAWAGQETADDKTSLDDSLEMWMTLFNKHDAKALAAEYTEDAEVTTKTGERLKGRAAIEKDLATLFAQKPNVKTRLTVISRRFLTPDLVVEDGKWEDSETSEARRTESGLYSSILARKDDKWLVVHEVGFVPLKNPQER